MAKQKEIEAIETWLFILTVILVITIITLVSVIISVVQLEGDVIKNKQYSEGNFKWIEKHNTKINKLETESNLFALCESDVK